MSKPITRSDNFGGGLKTPQRQRIPAGVPQSTKKVMSFYRRNGGCFSDSVRMIHSGNVYIWEEYNNHKKEWEPAKEIHEVESLLCKGFQIIDNNEMDNFLEFDKALWAEVEEDGKHPDEFKHSPYVQSFNETVQRRYCKTSGIALSKRELEEKDKIEPDRSYRIKIEEQADSYRGVLNSEIAKKILMAVNKLPMNKKHLVFESDLYGEIYRRMDAGDPEAHEYIAKHINPKVYGYCKEDKQVNIK